MKKNLTYLFALLFSFSLFSCEPYEDGPSFSLISKENRVEGEWYEESVTKNGTAQDASTATYTFEANQAYTYVSSLGTTSTGTWGFDDSQENLIITFELLGISTSQNWKLTRLSNSEMWFEYTDFFDDLYVYKLAKKK